MIPRFSIRALLFLTAVVSIVVAAITNWGIEVGILALFLGCANIAIFVRLFLKDKADSQSPIGWLVVAAVVVVPLTCLMIFGLLFGTIQ